MARLSRSLSIMGALLVGVSLGFAPAPAGAVSIDFGDSPASESPGLSVGGVSITGLYDNPSTPPGDAVPANVQINAAGIGVTARQNAAIMEGEAAVLDFGDSIVLEGFTLWQADARGFLDTFTITLDGDLVDFDQNPDGALTELPGTGQPSGGGRWFSFDVVGVATGSVLQVTGENSSNFRVKSVIFSEASSAVPEPSAALVFGLGLLIVRRRLTRC